MGFNRLHPAVQHHIVNSLGWKGLREIQENSIDPILEGEDLLVVGPTAGGKTEAAVLPLLSRMATDDWGGFSTIYISPLRALANDLEQRLDELFKLLGRSVEAWHGDVGPSRRKSILREPPDVLVTTPESLEVMLVSTKVDHQRFFSQLEAVVVDEIHSFGSDDRGWHLLSVLSRIEKLRGKRLQRIGLSATVGNPAELLEWFAMPASQKHRPAARVVESSSGARRDAEIRVDHVGSLKNAATVIAGLHHGEKRLVFCDSRSNVERVAAALRQLGVETYVSHSSLSRDERRQAETAFAEKSDCVIVSTSTLELGIDVGDLDRVIQIDAPTSVASFLQRMGRTGRRPGTTPNLLFLTIEPADLLRALGLALLWERRFVEDVKAPVEPRHVVAQQLLGLCLQEKRVGKNTWHEWISSAGLVAPGEEKAITDYMAAQNMVADDGEMIFIGEGAETSFGRRNFMDLLSVFTTPPLIEVRHGQEQLGSVHESSFYVKDNHQPILLLGGRSWDVDEIDWKRRRAYVVPAKEIGDSKWRGSGLPLSFELSRAMRDVLCGDDSPATLSSRAKGEIDSMRDRFSWASKENTTVVAENGRKRWWTFGGTLANLELNWRLGDLADTSSGSDELSVSLRSDATLDQVRERLSTEPSGVLPISEEAIEDLKFSECLETEMAERTLRRRAQDEIGVRHCISNPVSLYTAKV